MSLKPQPAPTASVALDLARLILDKPITREDRDQATMLVFDAITNALGARQEVPARLLRDWWAAATPGAKVADPGREAFMIGALVHTLEVDDLHRASVVHPGCVVVPAAWATARAVGADGRQFLDAVIRGMEAACRVGMAVGTEHYRLWHNTATCGPFGAAVAAGSLLGLEAQALAHALGNAGTQSAGLWEFLETGAMSKHLHAGRAAESGWIAASLAAHGFTGPRAIFEGDRGFFAATCPNGDPWRIARNPQARWQVHETSIKPWPCCRHMHPAMDAAGDLRKQLGARLDDVGGIAGVHVRTYQAAIDVTDRFHPETDYEAKFSMQHGVAAALARDTVSFETFGADARRDLASLRARVSLHHDPGFDEAYPGAWGAAVSIALRDGTRIDAARHDAMGDPELPLDRAQMEAKGHGLLVRGQVDHPEAWIELLYAIGRAPALPDLKPYIA